jgi:hypothetical protein
MGDVANQVLRDRAQKLIGVLCLLFVGCGSIELWPADGGALSVPSGVEDARPSHADTSPVEADQGLATARDGALEGTLSPDAGAGMEIHDGSPPVQDAADVHEGPPGCLPGALYPDPVLGLIPCP